MYVMLCGFFPFEYNDIQDIIKDTPQVSFDYPEWDSFSQESKDLIGKLLSVNSRLTAGEALRHVWFSKFTEFEDKVSIEIL